MDGSIGWADRQGDRTGAEAERGRQADRPAEIPRPGWRDILIRTWREISDDNVSTIAASVAFYAFLSLFPALAALVSIYGLVADVADVQRHVASLGGLLPGQATRLLDEQLIALAQQDDSSLSLGLVIGLALALWSAASGMKSMMGALNIAYDEKEKRGFIRLNLTALALTFGAILMVAIALGAVVVIPAMLSLIGFPDELAWLISLARWPVLAVLVVLTLNLLYRYGPSRAQPEWRWVTPGAVLAGVLWLIGSGLFSLYVSKFGSYEKTYGSVAAIVILMLWFNLTGFLIMLGAELNAEIEHQTTRDSTTGPDKPMGQRGARMADTVGETP